MKDCISVIIPVYNAEKYIGKAISSALLQKETGEVIVIDDKSTDMSLQVVSLFMQREKKVKLISLDMNLGSAAARNIGIDNATFPYISFLDADDYFIENRFENSIELLENNFNLDGVYAKVKNTYLGNFRSATYKHNDVIGTPTKIPSKDLFYYIMKEGGDFFSIISLVLRRRVLDNIRFDERFRTQQDIDFTYAIAQKLRLEESNDKSIKIFRTLHDSNITSSNLFETDNSRFKIVVKWANKCKKDVLPFKIKMTIYKRFTHYIYKNRNYGYPKLLKWTIKLIIFLRLVVKSNFDEEEKMVFSVENAKKNIKW